MGSHITSSQNGRRCACRYRHTFRLENYIPLRFNDSWRERGQWNWRVLREQRYPWKRKSRRYLPVLPWWIRSGLVGPAVPLDIRFPRCRRYAGETHSHFRYQTQRRGRITSFWRNASPVSRACPGYRKRRIFTGRLWNLAGISSRNPCIFGNKLRYSHA